ncbi:MAG: methyltransferase domain-containing protein [Acidobacteria bacterium]|nr:MAG: methyltransferase domain-containing protein [Acidobacteriota bacterium]
MNERVIRGFYDRFAGIYDFVFNGVFQPGRLEAVRAMDLQPGQRVLEVGVGTGLNLELYPEGVRVVGVDISLPMLREALERQRRRPPAAEVQLARMDALGLGFPDNTFDVVYAPYVVTVVPRPRQVVAEMARVCRPGGRVVVVNHFGSSKRPVQWFEKRLTPLTSHVGFRLDLPLEAILGVPGLIKEQERRVNAFGLWRLVVFGKRA